LFLFFFACFGTVLLVAAPIAAAAEAATEVKDGVGTFFERFAGFFSGNGWNTDEEAYFKLLSDETLGCRNSKIVTATIMYYYQTEIDTEISMGEVPEESENLNSSENSSNIDESGDDMYNETKYPYGKILPDLKRLIKKIKKSQDEYKKYVIDVFLEKGPYNEMLSDTEPKSDERNALKEKIYEEILSLSESVDCPAGLDYGYYSANCPGITVEGGDSPGTYPLEEYVAGVVKNENGGAGPEGLKVQAILARTYALKVTNNCSLPIKDSESQQTFTPATETVYIQAATETAGQVLLKDGELITSYYSSYPQAGYNGFPNFPICSNVDCDDTNCITTIYKVPDLEPISFTMPVKNSAGNYWNGVHLQNQTGHCYGFSQVGGRYLEETGLNYSEIINYFYSQSVAISSSALFSSGGWQIRTNAPTKGDELYVGYENIGQCVWYAKSRAIEILTNLMENGNMAESKAQAAINSLKNTYGNATDWYKNTSSKFTKISDPNNPIPGSIIVWSGGCNHSYGHVAIIEAIDSTAGTITITDSYSNNSDISSCPKSWDCIVFRTKTYSMDYFLNSYIKTGGGTCKKFVGYVNFVNNKF